MSADPDVVTLIGATGTIGPHVVAALADRGVRPRVLTRDAERARTVLGDLADGADIAEVDITDHDAVLAATAGASSLLLLTSHAHDMTDVQLRIIRALRRTDIRIVKISGTSSVINPDGPYTCRQHWEVEEILKAAGPRYVILRPNAYMQTLVGTILVPGVRATGVVANALGSAGISFIDARDVGECAAVALTSTQWDGQTLVLTGPRSVTFAEIAEQLGRDAGITVPVRDTTPADVGAMMRSRGMAAWEAEHFEEMYEMFRAGESEFVSADVRRMTGHEPRTVEAYLAEHAADFALHPQPAV